MTEWVQGTPAGGELVGQAADATALMVQQLHHAASPPQVLVWDARLRWRSDLTRLDALLEQDWFRAPHVGTEDDRIALDGLVEELDRSDWIATG